MIFLAECKVRLGSSYAEYQLLWKCLVIFAQDLNEGQSFGGLPQ